MSAYHAHTQADHGSSRIDARQASAMPASRFAWTGSLALRACDATRVTIPAPCCDTKRRDIKWEVDSKAEVDGS